MSAKKDRKEDIFEAALKCFNETGYYKTTIDKIAEKAKISKGGIYYHFKSKEELFLKRGFKFEVQQLMVFWCSVFSPRRILHTGI